MAGIAKAYNLSFEYVLYDLSYENLLLYSAVLPTYDLDDAKDGGENEMLNGDDPDDVERFFATM